jgi:5-methyltetrahydropteroyltriglutamate--homocysteine methyltransferase
MTKPTENEQMGLPSQLDHLKNVVEHPELAADRLVRFANIVGRENVMAGTDCGFAKVRSLAESTRRFSGRSSAPRRKVRKSPPRDYGAADNPPPDMPAEPTFG